jgi:adenylate kinase family enzyme
MDEGKLPPAFLAVHMWSHDLIERYDGTSTVFLDGTPRVPDEVPLLLSAAELYNWTIDVIYLHTSDKWAYDRMKGRGREDDTSEKEITERIHWFHTSVEPCLDILRSSPLVRFHDVHGEQSIEAVHSDICKEVGL